MSFKKTRRGGSWGYGSLATARDEISQHGLHYGIGFRLVAREEMYKVLRGGAWLGNGMMIVRSAYRKWLQPTVRDRFFGFRLAERNLKNEL